MSRFMTLGRVNKSLDILAIGFSDNAYELYGRTQDVRENFPWTIKSPRERNPYKIKSESWSLLNYENTKNDHVDNVAWARRSYQKIFDNHRVDSRYILCIIGCPGPLIMGVISPLFYKSQHPVIAMFKPGQGVIVIQVYERLLKKYSTNFPLSIGDKVSSKFFTPDKRHPLD